MIGQVLEAVLLVVRSYVDHTREWPSPNIPAYILGSFLVWLCLDIFLLEIPDPFWPAYLLAWLSSASFDTLYLANTARLADKSGWNYGLNVLRGGRVFLTLVIVIYGFSTAGRTKNFEAKASDETRSLLSSSDHDAHGYENGNAEYGAIEAGGDAETDGDDSDSDEDDREIKALQKKRIEEKGGWLGYLKGFTIFLPYILPYNDRFTQVWLLILATCVGVQRVLIIMIPKQLGAITDDLGNAALTGHVPWKEIIIWGLLQFPGNGITDLLKDMSNTRVSQYAYSQLKSAAFAHVMSLSMDYHSVKSSGKLTKAIEQGTDLTSIIDNIFTAGPMLIDLVIAAIYLTSKFDVYMGFIVLTTSILHIYATLKVNAVNVPRERISSERTRVESEVLYDSVTNWTTVAFFNRRKFEQGRYGRAVRNSVMAERSFYDGIDYGKAVQTFILDAGLVVAASLAASRVAAGTAPMSSFVFLVVYWTSIREPMSMISWTFHETSKHLINAEWLFQLLQNEPSILDKPNAKDLIVSKGSVEFTNVAFSYDPQRPILRDVTFKVQPGQSVALVGETGGGKSTVLKLLYRFYDVNSGSITIDGRDLRDIKLDSLRDALGAVPQEPSVFDQTIMENVRYAHPDATTADVEAACKAAQIHDQIQKFPDGYNTRLGERGVRLSGGELQRLAIARVILRKPKIVVLDEATSAVDSGTEKSVQQALRTLSAGRTVFTVAHRLSTVVGADLILVIDQGMVVERGSHQQLLSLGGKYSSLWSMQTTAQAEGGSDESAEEQGLVGDGRQK